MHSGNINGYYNWTTCIWTDLPSNYPQNIIYPMRQPWNNHILPTKHANETTRPYDNKDYIFKYFLIASNKYADSTFESPENGFEIDM